MNWLDAADIIDEMMACDRMQKHCDFKCKYCPGYVSRRDRRLALRTAYAALKKIDVAIRRGEVPEP